VFSDNHDVIYHFPEIGLTDLGGLRADSESPARYSPSDALAVDRKTREREADISHLRAELEEINAHAREDAMDRPPPATVRAYRQVYGRDPRGWPPA
jgi:hypothetical protein